MFKLKMNNHWLAFELLTSFSIYLVIVDSSSFLCRLGDYMFSAAGNIIRSAIYLCVLLSKFHYYIFLKTQTFPQ